MQKCDLWQFIMAHFLFTETSEISFKTFEVELELFMKG